MAKKQITVDTWVLCEASKEKSESAVKARKFLKKMYKNCHRIVIDRRENRILKEYKTNAKGFALEWLISVMRRKKKLLKVDLTDCSIKDVIKKDKFDNKFVYACYLSDDKVLVTGDHSFQDPSVRFMLSKCGIKLLELDEATDFV